MAVTWIARTIGLLASIVRAVAAVIGGLIIVHAVFVLFGANAHNVLVQFTAGIRDSFGWFTKNLFQPSDKKIAEAINDALAGFIWVFLGSLVAKFIARLAPASSGKKEKPARKRDDTPRSTPVQRKAPDQPKDEPKQAEAPKEEAKREKVERDEVEREAAPKQAAPKQEELQQEAPRFDEPQDEAPQERPAQESAAESSAKHQARETARDEDQAAERAGDKAQA